jgi:hypothetical protein
LAQLKKPSVPASSPLFLTWVKNSVQQHMDLCLILSQPKEVEKMRTDNATHRPLGRADTVSPAAPSSRKGLIIMPDISGFTSFVHHTELQLGRQITAELLTSILEHNVLELQVSEIEGDAVLFYRCGPLPPVARILDQYEHMLAGFNQKLAELNQRLAQPLDLTLKLVAHYGDLAEYRVGGFRKLYGESVIEAHRLLKNSLDSHTYALITDDLTAAASPALAQPRRPGVPSSKQCEGYSHLRNICFTYFDYEAVVGLQLVA